MLHLFFSSVLLDTIANGTFLFFSDVEQQKAGHEVTQKAVEFLRFWDYGQRDVGVEEQPFVLG